MTLDGNCDHTAGIPDADVHQHYTELLGQADAILYGRTTYQLMEYWRGLLEQPSEEASMNAFAAAINRIPKTVFSHSLQELDWDTARLAQRELHEEVLALRQQAGKDILVGSRSLIIQLMNLQLIDELQLCIHPVIAGPGLQLLDYILERTLLQLVQTKRFSGGGVILYYELNKN